MPKQYHILNGDSLQGQFPSSILGKTIVARECLVDGDVTGTTLDELFSMRAAFLTNFIDTLNEKNYYQTTVAEFERMQQIPENSEINLWFEDDLFCQVNLWFVFHLLKENCKNSLIYLVRPNKGNEYSFGNMSKSELTEAFQNRIKIELKEFQKLAKLWRFYQNNEIDRIVEIANNLKINYPFLLPAIYAHSNRIHRNGQLGRPVQSLIQIKKELETSEFDPVFKEFCKREAIYGFGDVQVKRMLDELVTQAPK